MFGYNKIKMSGNGMPFQPEDLVSLLLGPAFRQEVFVVRFGAKEEDSDGRED
jgi:hypothetical protein